MKTEILDKGRVTVIVLEGVLDFQVADQVRRTVTDLVRQGRSKLVVDLGRVPQIDSSGLGALVAGQKQARASGGDLGLCAVQPEVRTTLEITGLIKLIAVHPDREEAVSKTGS